MQQIAPLQTDIHSPGTAINDMLSAQTCTYPRGFIYCTYLLASIDWHRPNNWEILCKTQALCHNIIAILELQGRVYHFFLIEDVVRKDRYSLLLQDMLWTDITRVVVVAAHKTIIEYGPCSHSATWTSVSSFIHILPRTSHLQKKGTLGGPFH